MYTGYFAKEKKYRELGLVPVSISLYTPQWFNGAKYTKLSPNTSILFSYEEGKLDQDGYARRFINEVLNQLDYKAVIADLEVLTNTNQENIVLLCYEKASDFCHRHIVAEWLSYNNVECKECLKNDSKI